MRKVFPCGNQSILHGRFHPRLYWFLFVFTVDWVVLSVNEHNYPVVTQSMRNPLLARYHLSSFVFRLSPLSIFQYLLPSLSGIRVHHTHCMPLWSASYNICMPHCLHLYLNLNLNLNFKSDSIIHRTKVMDVRGISGTVQNALCCNFSSHWRHARIPVAV